MPGTTGLIRTQANTHCYLCGDRGRILYANLTDTLFGASGRWSLKRCSNTDCRLIWLDPRPVDEDLGKTYQTYFTHGEDEREPSMKRRMREFLYSGYRGLISVADPLLGLKQEKRRLRQMCLDGISPGTLLDVGCGDGSFLDRMRKAGWEVDGCDFDPQGIAHAKMAYGLKLRVGTLEAQEFRDNQFEAVTVSHVIEHVTDPGALLREVCRTLKPGGRAVITTPNSASHGHETFRAAWFGLDPPRHLHLFNVENLACLAERSGMRIIERFSTAANADIFLGASASIQEAAQHGGSTNLSAINPLRGIQAFFGQCREHRLLRENKLLGEEAVLVCVKPDAAVEKAQTT